MKFEVAPIVDPPVWGLAVMLNFATVAALAFAAVGAFVPGQAWLGATAITTIIAVPLVRVAMLAWHWSRRGDRRYAGLAVALLLLVAVGALVAAAG